MYFGLLLVVAGVAVAIWGSNVPALSEILPASRVTIAGIRMTREAAMAGGLVILGLVVSAMSASAAGRVKIQCASCGWHGPLTQFHGIGRCPRCGSQRFSGREIGKISSF